VTVKPEVEVSKTHTHLDCNYLAADVPEIRLPVRTSAKAAQ
jgi:hypothetical protein